MTGSRAERMRRSGMAVTVLGIAAVSTIVWVGVVWLVVVACVDDRRRENIEATSSSRAARGYGRATRGKPLQVRSGNQLAVSAPPVPSAPPTEAHAPRSEAPQLEVPAVGETEASPAQEWNRDIGWGKHSHQA